MVLKVIFIGLLGGLHSYPRTLDSLQDFSTPFRRHNRNEIEKIGNENLWANRFKNSTFGKLIPQSKIFKILKIEDLGI